MDDPSDKKDGPDIPNQTNEANQDKKSRDQANDPETGSGLSRDEGDESSAKKSGFLDWKVLLACGVGLFIFVFYMGTSLNLDNILRNNLIASLQATMPVSATIQAVKSQPEENKLNARGLVIGNPQGFESPVSVVVRAVFADIGGFQDNRLTLDRISLQDTTIYLAINENGTNLTAIHEALDEFASLEAARLQSEEAEEPVLPLEVRVDRVDFGGATVNLMVDGRPLEPLSLSSQEFSGPGTDDFPVTVSQAITGVFSYIVRDTVALAYDSGALDALDRDLQKQIRAQVGLDLKSQARDRLGEWGDDVKTFLRNNTPEKLNPLKRDQ